MFLEGETRTKRRRRQRTVGIIAAETTPAIGMGLSGTEIIRITMTGRKSAAGITTSTAASTVVAEIIRKEGTTAVDASAMHATVMAAAETTVANAMVASGTAATTAAAVMAATGTMTIRTEGRSVAETTTANAMEANVTRIGRLQ